MTETKDDEPNDENIRFFNLGVKQGKLKALDHIALHEGWEDTRDMYARDLGLEWKYIDRYHPRETAKVSDQQNWEIALW